MLGVLGVRTRSVDAVRLRRCRMLTGIVAMAITSKRAYSDSFARRARVERMQLPAEMLRAFLPPRTIGNAHVVSTAVLEPAYEIGGDAFDHSLTQSTLHAAILDAMGHDLASGLTTSVALAGCRNARRAGAGLLDLVGTIDQALAQWLPDTFCTGILTQLDLASGVFRDRFTDSIILATAAGELAAESLRRLIHSILDSEDSDLRDDATMLLVERWPPAVKPAQPAAHMG